MSELIDLIDKVYDAVSLSCQNITQDDNRIGIAFSGGVDSSLLAKVCKDLGFEISLITIGFKDSQDIHISQAVSKKMKIPLFTHIINEEKLEEDLKIIFSLIGFQSLIRFENALAFYYTASKAEYLKLPTLLSANGLDELFCGYHCYKDILKIEGKDAVILEIKNQIEKAKADKEKIDTVVGSFNIKKIDPFLTDKFIEYSLNIPISEKVEYQNGYTEKAIIRRLALKIGVPKTAALRPKKAFQYGSRIHNRFQRLANKRYTREELEKKGMKSKLELYFHELNH